MHHPFLVYILVGMPSLHLFTFLMFYFLYTILVATLSIILISFLIDLLTGLLQYSRSQVSNGMFRVCGAENQPIIFLMQILLSDWSEQTIRMI